MKYSRKGHKDKKQTQAQNRKGGQARLVYVMLVYNIPTTRSEPAGTQIPQTLTNSECKCKRCQRKSNAMSSHQSQTQTQIHKRPTAAQSVILNAVSSSNHCLQSTRFHENTKQQDKLKLHEIVKHLHQSQEPMDAE